MLSERGRAELFRPVPLADGTATEFALGFRVKDDDGRRLLHQPGGGIGISAWLFVYPDDDPGRGAAVERPNRAGWRCHAPGDHRRLLRGDERVVPDGRASWSSHPESEERVARTPEARHGPRSW
jgi:hypothetical protein